MSNNFLQPTAVPLSPLFLRERTGVRGNVGIFNKSKRTEDVISYKY
jgi:hypothetical protein